MGNLLPRCHIRRDRARNLQLVCYRFVIGLQTAKVHRIVSTEIPLKNEWKIVKRFVQKRRIQLTMMIRKRMENGALSDE